jgi:hypothetical protein
MQGVRHFFQSNAKRTVQTEIYLTMPENGKTMNLNKIINAKYFGQDIYAKH